MTKEEKHAITSSQRSILHMWDPTKSDEKSINVADQESKTLSQPESSQKTHSKRSISKAERSSSTEGRVSRPRRSQGSTGSAPGTKRKGRTGNKPGQQSGLLPFFSRTVSTTSQGSVNDELGPPSQGSRTENTHSSPHTSPPASVSSRSATPDIVCTGSNGLSGAVSPDVIIKDDGRSINIGTSREKPIIVDASPERPSKENTKASAPLTGFFAPRKLVGSLPALSTRRKPASSPAVWPDSTQQHVRGEQATFSSENVELSRREKDLSPIQLLDTYLKSSTIPRSEAILSQAEPSSTEKNSSEALASTTDAALDNRCHLPSYSWNDKWRPRCADDILANSEVATYLRDWLLALEIKSSEGQNMKDVEAESNDQPQAAITRESGTSKRPKIIRTVDRPRKKRRVESDEEDLDEWLVDDDEDDTVYVRDVISEESDEEQASITGSPWKPKLTRLSRSRTEEPSIQETIQPGDTRKDITPTHDFSGYLTNSILLSGPNGSGKTAAVYACAEELGWEVFEVYPGIGKRNGSSLMSLVGDVGKNHTVGKGPRPGPSVFPHENRIDQLLSSPRRPKSVNNRGVSTSPSRSRCTPDVFSGRGQTPFDPDGKRKSPQQSIILLEEVDILFGDDIHFWPTVVALIRESRRPVIMTCNDTSLVPIEILPLQSTLTFNVPPCDTATAYLRRLTLTEGHEVAEEVLKALYEGEKTLELSCFSHDLAAYSVCPRPSTPDLRRAINALQFLCSGYSGFSDSASAGTSLLHHQMFHTDDELDIIPGYDLSEEMPDLAESAPLSSNPSDEQICKDMMRLWRLSNSSSEIDSRLSRRSAALLEKCALEDTSEDYELGHKQLVHDPEISHLQGGIVMFNKDHAIALEAMEKNIHAFKTSGPRFVTIRAERRGIREGEIIEGQKKHAERIRGILGCISWMNLTKCVEELVLDYEPWVQKMDEADAVLEANALKDSEMRVAGRSGRMTRNSQRAHYERHFSLSEEHRIALHGSRLSGVGMGNELSGCAGADGSE